MYRVCYKLGNKNNVESEYECVGYDLYQENIKDNLKGGYPSVGQYPVLIFQLLETFHSCGKVNCIKPFS